LEGAIDFDQGRLARTLLELEPGNVLEDFEAGDVIFAGALERLGEEFEAYLAAQR
jgi:hypothetical protein